ncbi:hypothetical protein ACO0LO_03615 [Undibacterium sp. TJN25]|uniref:hypothetical protein n=1 Tax=Undibacterium sp. TJN25 TaxID=3413056 RepID=UPI003BF28B80
MEIRELLVSCYAELDNGVTSAVPIDVFEQRVLNCNVPFDVYAQGLDSAIADGNFAILSPGMIAFIKSDVCQAGAGFPG